MCAILKVRYEIVGIEHRVSIKRQKEKENEGIKKNV